MKLKLFIFLTLLFATFLFSSAAVAEKSKDETKLEVAEEVNQVEDDKQYGCRYRCCGHYGCRCCTFAEITAEELNQQNEVKYEGNGYGRGGYGGGRGGYGGGQGGYGGGRGGGYGGGRGGGGHGGGHGGGGGGRGGRGGGGGGYGAEANP